MTEDEKFVEALMKAMLEPITDDPEPCCGLWMKALHHHWKPSEEKLQ